MNKFTNGLLLAFLAVEALLFLISGFLLIVRRERKPIRVRSPILLSISHWSNFFETIIIIYMIDLYESQPTVYDWAYILVTLVHFFIHYLYFIPFLLRAYRLYLIFYIDKNYDPMDKLFKKKVKRTSEKWLLKVALAVALPFILVSIVVYSIGPPFNFLLFKDSASSYNEKYGEAVHIVALLVTFIEQLLMIFLINLIRNIHDHFSMTKELICISLTWILTSPNNVFGFYSTYSYQILMRNNIVLIFSSLLPLIKSYKSQVFEMPITEEVLESLDQIFTHKFTFEAFELFLKNSELHYKHISGIQYLHIWLRCEYSKTHPTYQLSLDDFKTFSPETELKAFQCKAFEILEHFFFPIFKVSEQFRSCLKEVNFQNIYNSRLEQTSLGQIYNIEL